MSGHRLGSQGPLHQDHIDKVVGACAEVPVWHTLATMTGKLGEVKNRGSWPCVISELSWQDSWGWSRHRQELTQVHCPGDTLAGQLELDSCGLGVIRACHACQDGWVECSPGEPQEVQCWASLGGIEGAAVGKGPATGWSGPKVPAEMLGLCSHLYYQDARRMLKKKKKGTDLHL